MQLMNMQFKQANITQTGRRLMVALLAGIILLTGFAMPVQAQSQEARGHLQCLQTHTVQRGENLYRIGLRYNVTVRTLQQWNQITNPNRIFVGQRLCVKVGSHVPQPQPQPQPQDPGAYPTDVEFVQTLTNVNIRRGPGTTYGVVGQFRTGTTARVTGISADGRWWRVVCPNDSASSCWITALSQYTRPVGGPGQGPDWGTSAAIVGSVSIQVRESYPVQVVAVVRGHLPDGCTYIDRFRQVREGNTIRIQLTTGRNPGFCTQALVPFEQVITLDVANWHSGLYSVVVDNVRSDFYLP